MKAALLLLVAALALAGCGEADQAMVYEQGDAGGRSISLRDSKIAMKARASALQAEVDGLMRDNLLPTNKYQPGFTPMVVNTGSQLILFDTGNGAKGFVPRPHGGWLVDQLAPAGFAPEAFDLVILSHGHPDHIGGMIENGRPLFPNARYAIGETEYDFWAKRGGQGSGLGLTLASRLAAEHDGKIEYRARDGGGSAFTLRLPAESPSASSSSSLMG